MTDAPVAHAAHGHRPRRFRKRVLLFVGLVALMLVVTLSRVPSLLEHRERISEYLRALGWRGDLLFTGACYLLMLVGTPRLVLCGIGGLTFGFWHGLLLTQAATVAAYYTLFLFFRNIGKDYAIHHWPKLDRFAHMLHRGGVLTVLFARQLPIGGFYLCILLALTPITHASYLLGTLIGLLPEAAPAVLVGAGVAADDTEKMFHYIGLAVILLVVVWGGLLWYMRRNQPADLAEVSRSVKEESENGNGNEQQGV